MKDNLDKEEQKLLESFEKGEWERIRNQEVELKKFQQIARQSQTKDKRSISGFRIAT